MLPRQRVPMRIVRKGVPVAQINEKILEALRLVPLERIQERVAAQKVDALVRQTTEEISVGVQLVLLERMQERVGEQIVALPDQGGHRGGDSVEVTQVPHEHIQEQMVDVFKSNAQVRASERIGEWDTQFQEQIVKVFQVIPQQWSTRVFVDLVPPHTASMPSIGKVFSGEMPHRRMHSCTEEVFYCGDAS